MQVNNIKKLVCIGDSLTAGYGVNTDKSWPALLEKKLQIEVGNAGISGDTTAGILARFEKDVLQSSPSHVCIMGGTNDVWLGMDFPILIGNILAMVRQANHYGIQPIIGIPPQAINAKDNRSDNIFMEYKDYILKLNNYAFVLKKFCKRDQQVFVDFHTFTQKEYYLSDGLHPNEKGHALMKALFLK